jgi:hypothetical protein
VFVPGKPFQPRLMFVSKAGTYPSEAPFRCSTLLVPGLTHTTIGPGWKGLPGTNTLAYYGNPYITAAISLMIQAPGVCIIKLLKTVIKFVSSYARVLVTVSHFYPSLIFECKAPYWTSI